MVQTVIKSILSWIVVVLLVFIFKLPFYFLDVITKPLKLVKLNPACQENIKSTTRSFKSTKYILIYVQNCYMEVHLAAILKNGRHLGFSYGQSGRFAKYTLVSHHAKYFAYITICTISLLSAPLKENIQRMKKQEGQSPYGSHVSEKFRISYNENKNIVEGQVNPM